MFCKACLILSDRETSWDNYKPGQSSTWLKVDGVCEIKNYFSSCLFSQQVSIPTTYNFTDAPFRLLRFSTRHLTTWPDVFTLFYWHILKKEAKIVAKRMVPLFVTCSFLLAASTGALKIPDRVGHSVETLNLHRMSTLRCLLKQSWMQITPAMRGRILCIPGLKMRC